MHKVIIVSLLLVQLNVTLVCLVRNRRIRREIGHGNTVSIDVPRPLTVWGYGCGNT